MKCLLVSSMTLKAFWMKMNWSPPKKTCALDFDFFGAKFVIRLTEDTNEWA